MSDYQGEERRTIQWTERDFVSDDPIERRLLPLVKKIVESNIPEVAASGPELYRTLRDFKPVRSRWVNEAMKRWREHPDPRVQLRYTEELFQALLDLSNDYPFLEPNRYSYGFVVGIRGYHARETNDIRSMQQAEQYLTDMWARWEESRVSRTKAYRQHPGLFLYRTVFRGWIRFALLNRAAETQSCEKALSLLKEMKELCQDGFHEYKPDDKFQEELVSISFFLNKCCIESMPTLEGIVRELEASFNGELQPNQLKLFANIRREMIHKYMQNKALDTETTISKVLPLLNEWWETCRHAEDPFTRLNVIYINKFITAASRSKIRDAYPRSQALLQETWRIYHETGDDSIKPNSLTYGSVMNALSKSGMDGAGEKAGELLQEMWDIYNSDKIKNKEIKPQVVVYNSAVLVWTKSNDKNSGDESEKLLREMWDRYNAGDEDFKPTNRVYSQVIAAMRNVDGGVGRGMALLQEMWDLYNSDETKNEDVKPNTVVYNCMMQVWAESNEMNSAFEAGTLLKEMWSRYTAGDKEFKPRTSHYNQVIFALSSLGDKGVDRADALLEALWGIYNRDNSQNKDLKPDGITYANMLRVWTRSGKKNAIQRSEALIQDMWDRYNDGDKDLKPNHIHYTQVHALTKNRESSMAP